MGAVWLLLAGRKHLTCGNRDTEWEAERAWACQYRVPRHKKNRFKAKKKITSRIEAPIGFRVNETRELMVRCHLLTDWIECWIDKDNIDGCLLDCRALVSIFITVHPSWSRAPPADTLQERQLLRSCIQRWLGALC